MNRKRYLQSLIVATLVAFVVVTACQNPAALLNGSRSTGLISVQMSAVSPAVTALLQPPATSTSLPSRSVAGGTTSSSGATAGTPSARTMDLGSRAYLSADTVHFTLYDSSGTQVQTWDYAASSDFSTPGISPPTAETVPAGNGYTLNAEVFNNNNSTTTPVVAGTSAPFNVVVSTTASTSVSISCLPFSPTTLTVGGAAATPSLLPWVLSAPLSSGSATVVQTGQEQWYAISLTAGTNASVSVTPSTSSYAGVFVYDSTGKEIAQGGSVDVGQVASASLFPTVSGTYYVGLIDFVTTTGAAAQQLSVSATQGLSAPLLLFYAVQPNGTLTGQSVAVVWPWPTTGVSFEVQRDTDPLFTNPAPTVVSADPASAIMYDSSNGYWWFMDASATFGQDYYYRVVATDSTSSTQFTSGAVTAAAPAPTSVTAVYDNNNGITLSWATVSGATDYQIDLVDSSGNSITGLSASSLSYTTSSSTATVDIPNGAYTTGSNIFVSGSTYYFEVAAYVGGHFSGYFNVSNGVTYTGQ